MVRDQEIKSISEMLTLSEQISDIFLKENADAREWMILGNTINILKEKGELIPVFAKKCDPPDFITFDSNGEEFCHIEVTEILTPNRRRNDEQKFKEGESKYFDPKRVDDPWSTLLTGLKKKLEKKYPQNTWLIIYHNMPSWEYGFSLIWHNEIFKIVNEWFEKKDIDNKTISIEKIFIIDCSYTGLVCIYPEFRVITPKHK